MAVTLALVSLPTAGERELRASAARFCHGRQPFGDCALQDHSGIDCVAGAGEPIDEPARHGVAPQILARHDLAGMAAADTPSTA